MFRVLLDLNKVDMCSRNTTTLGYISFLVLLLLLEYPRYISFLVLLLLLEYSRYISYNYSYSQNNHTISPISSLTHKISQISPNTPTYSRISRIYLLVLLLLLEYPRYISQIFILLLPRTSWIYFLVLLFLLEYSRYISQYSSYSTSILDLSPSIPPTPRTSRIYLLQYLGNLSYFSSYSKNILFLLELRVSSISPCQYSSYSQNILIISPSTSSTPIFQSIQEYLYLVPYS